MKFDIEQRFIIAHRGASAYAPENTFAAMHKAAELNIPWVEFDVTLTADNVPIVFHDDKLNRTTSGKGEVAKTNYVDIINLDAGSWFAKAFRGEPVPKFDILLHYLAKLNLSINVEIKPSRGKEKETAQAVVQVLNKCWVGRRSNLLVSSFSIESLQEARRLDKTLPLGLLVKKWFPGWHSYLHSLECISLHAKYSILTPEIIKQLRNEGFLVLAYTVDDLKKAQQLYNWGINAVFSNVPDRIKF